MRRQYTLLALCDDQGQGRTLGSDEVIRPSSGYEFGVIVAEIERNILSLSLSTFQESLVLWVLVKVPIIAQLARLLHLGSGDYVLGNSFEQHALREGSPGLLSHWHVAI